jgi:serine/threonine protein kinase
MAPELLDGKIYSKAVDIWSAGIIMYMLLNHGKHPYYESGDSEQTIRHKINKIH